MTFGLYVHVPFCRTRCGYCDFTTYAPDELGGATPEGYLRAALDEMALAHRVLQESGAPLGSRQADTVFFGGGTPTMLPVAALRRLFEGIEATFGVTEGAEVTIEANPDSVTAGSLEALAEAGFTRVSLGMQSAVARVLATLERTHRPENVVQAVEGAKAAGLSVSLDLIYGTPGESVSDWTASVATALDLEPDHLSAYALVIETRTRMGASLSRGEIDPVDPDLQAEMYEAADDAFRAAGYEWYEVSSWARDGHRCRHNLGYWSGADWWGIGPGAHSHLGARDGSLATRWWNVKHPLAYSERLRAGESPEDGREELTDEQVRAEEILLGVRVREGLDISLLSDRESATKELEGDGLLDGEALRRGRVVLSRRGRLLADVVVRALT